MAGTRAGAAKAKLKIKEKYGEDFYKEIGAMGGKKSRTGGFYANRELAKTAGAKGGRKSRRTGTKNSTDKRLEAHNERGGVLGRIRETIGL